MNNLKKLKKVIAASKIKRIAANATFLSITKKINFVSDNQKFIYKYVFDKLNICKILIKNEIKFPIQLEVYNTFENTINTNIVKNYFLLTLKINNLIIKTPTPLLIQRCKYLINFALINFFFSYYTKLLLLHKNIQV